MTVHHGLWAKCIQLRRLNFYKRHTPNQLKFSFLALSVFDSFGKPGSGILVGDYIWIGTYEECQDLKGFHYCMVDLIGNISSFIPPELKVTFSARFKPKCLTRVIQIIGELCKCLYLYHVYTIIYQRYQFSNFYMKSIFPKKI